MTTDNNEEQTGEDKLDVPSIKVDGTLSNDPNEMAATLMTLYTPKYIMGVDRLSSKALRRVLKKLVSYPLNEKTYAPTTQLEADVFNVGDRLSEARFLLNMASYANIIESDLKEELKDELAVTELDVSELSVVESSNKEGN